MSLDATRWAWSLSIRPSQKLILLSLADRADEHHRCWPSLRRLAKDTGLDERTINAAILQLCEDGILRRFDRGPGKGYSYTLIGVSGREDVPQNCTPHKNDRGVQKRTPRKNAPTPPQNCGEDPPHFCDSHHIIESTNESTKNLPEYSASAPPDAAHAPPLEPDFYPTKKKRKLTGKRLATFNRFWTAFAYPKGKAEAADAWLDIPAMTEALVTTIVTAAEREAAARPQLVERGGTPKYAQGWLTSRRWEDEEDAASALPHLADARKFVRRYGGADGVTHAEALKKYCIHAHLDFEKYAPHVEGAMCGSAGSGNAQMGNSGF